MNVRQASEVARISAYVDSESTEASTDDKEAHEQARDAITAVPENTIPTQERKPVLAEKAKPSTTVEAAKSADDGELDMVTATATWTPVDGWEKWDEKWRQIGRKRKKQEEAPEETFAKDEE